MEPYLNFHYPCVIPHSQNAECYYLAQHLESDNQSTEYVFSSIM